MKPPRLAWTWKRFEALSLDELYDALALRCRVFILEQGAYLDPDGLDRVSWHLLGRGGQGALHAYLRVVDPGAKFSEPSMGRVITSPELRGTGAGALGARQAQPVPRTGCVQALSPGSGCARPSSLTSLRGIPEPSGCQRSGGDA